MIQLFYLSKRSVDDVIVVSINLHFILLLSNIFVQADARIEYKDCIFSVFMQESILDVVIIFGLNVLPRLNHLWLNVVSIVPTVCVKIHDVLLAWKTDISFLN